MNANKRVKNDKCPIGYKMRKGYTRKFKPNILSTGFTVRRKGKLYTAHPKKAITVIPSSCIKIRNSNTASIGKLRKGDLIRYGYQYRLSDRLRRSALRKAIDAYGALVVYKKLDAVAKLSVSSAPDASQIFKSDRDWVRKLFVK
jgi:hypothetical protein